MSNERHLFFKQPKNKQIQLCNIILSFYYWRFPSYFLLRPYFHVFMSISMLFVLLSISSVVICIRICSYLVVNLDEKTRNKEKDVHPKMVQFRLETMHMMAAKSAPFAE